MLNELLILSIAESVTAVLLPQLLSSYFGADVLLLEELVDVFAEELVDVADVFMFLSGFL